MFILRMHKNYLYFTVGDGSTKYVVKHRERNSSKIYMDEGRKKESKKMV